MGTGAVFIQTNGSNGVTTGAPANLTFGFTGTSANDITLRTGSGTECSIDTGSNTVTLSNKLSISGSNNTGNSTIFNKTGSGTLAITGALDTLNRQPGIGGALATGGGNASLNLRDGTFDVSGSSNSTITFNGLAGSVGTTLALGGKALNATSGSFSGTISGTGGTVVKSASGTLTLSGNNTYSGGTTITASGLRLGSNTGAGSGNIALNFAYGTSYLSGGAAALASSVTGLNVSNNLVVSSTAGYYALQSAGAAGSTVEWSGTISGGGAGVVLQIDTPNIGDSTTTATLSGDNSFGGQIRLNRGRLVVGHANALGTADLFLQTNGNSTDGNLAFASGVTSLSNKIIIGTTTGQMINTGTQDITLSGVISSSTSGSGGFSKTGSGTLTLTGVNAYSGSATSVASGTLEIGGAGQLGSGSYGGAIAIAGTLEVNTSADQTFSGAISGAGSLVKDNSGTLTLSGNSSTYTGTTTVTAGTLLLSGQLGGNVTVSGTLGGGGTIGGDLAFLTGSDFDISDILSGSNPLSVAGSVTFGTGFGIDDLTGVVWADVADGIYTLIDTTSTDFSLAGLDHFGIGEAFEIGGGRGAYFSPGSLQLVVVPVLIPEPSAALLGGLGLLALLRRRVR
jgi:autotransporter-associated beta strand protein